MPAFETSSSTTSASRTNTTVTAPTGIADGDLLLLFHDCDQTTAPDATPPSGFDLIPGSWPVFMDSAGWFMRATRVACRRR